VKENYTQNKLFKNPNPGNQNIRKKTRLGSKRKWRCVVVTYSKLRWLHSKNLKLLTWGFPYAVPTILHFLFPGIPNSKSLFK